MSKIRNGFTLLEFIIVLILLGIIAAFGIPSFSKGRERAHENEGQFNLEVIAAAMENYEARQSGYPPANLPQVTDINTTLSLGIIEQEIDYACTSSAATFTCTAASSAPNNVWTLSISNTSNGVVSCSAGPCPTL